MKLYSPLKLILINLEKWIFSFFFFYQYKMRLTVLPFLSGSLLLLLYL
jgi:hypothetical protein